MEVYSVYVLYSHKDKKHYTGLSTDISNRLEQHNSGKVKSTCSRRPLSVIYSEVVGTLTDARKREQYLKSAAGRRFLKEYFLKNSLM
jgi:putative endonuclease